MTRLQEPHEEEEEMQVSETVEDPHFREPPDR
jgi:hypothetical protein